MTIMLYHHGEDRQVRTHDRGKAEAVDPRGGGNSRRRGGVTMTIIYFSNDEAAAEEIEEVATMME